jgi:hypothetical protein
MKLFLRRSVQAFDFLSALAKFTTAFNNFLMHQGTVLHLALTAPSVKIFLPTLPCRLPRLG